MTAEYPEAPDPIAAMRAHIAHLESELAIAANQLNVIESGAADRARRAQGAIEIADYQRAREELLRDHATGEALDEEVGLLKADIRVLRVLLDECHEWLQIVAERASGGTASREPSV